MESFLHRQVQIRRYACGMRMDKMGNGNASVPWKRSIQKLSEILSGVHRAISWRVSASIARRAFGKSNKKEQVSTLTLSSSYRIIRTRSSRYLGHKVETTLDSILPPAVETNRFTYMKLRRKTCLLAKLVMMNLSSRFRQS